MYSFNIYLLLSPVPITDVANMNHVLVQQEVYTSIILESRFHITRRGHPYVGYIYLYAMYNIIYGS